MSTNFLPKGEGLAIFFRNSANGRSLSGLLVCSVQDSVTLIFVSKAEGISITSLILLSKNYNAGQKKCTDFFFYYYTLVHESINRERISLKREMGKEKRERKRSLLSNL